MSLGQGGGRREERGGRREEGGDRRIIFHAVILSEAKDLRRAMGSTQ
jgi:hypothetical protein